jgi:hypothetical protein
MLTILVFEIKDGKNAQKVKKNINCNLSLLIREKGLFLWGQNVISWGGTRGDWGGGICPPSLYVKKGPDENASKILEILREQK